MIGFEQVYGIGTVGMVCGTATFLWSGLSSDSETRLFYWLLAAIGGIASVAYVLMTLGVGWQSVAGGSRVVFLPRYVDWILTTPLLVAFLGLLADCDRATLGRLVGVNTVVMLLGTVAALQDGLVSYGLFAAASVAFAALLWLLVAPVSRQASQQPRATYALFRRLRNLTVVLWSVYPIVWLLGPPGLAVLTTTVDVMLVVYLDLLTKVGFGLIALDASSVLDDHRASLPGPDRDEDTDGSTGATGAQP
jgi:sensory rhodopsin